MTPEDIFGIIIGCTIAFIVPFYVFAFPILRYKRRYYYDKNPSKYGDKLLDPDYHAYITTKTNIKIDQAHLSELVKYEYENFKNQPLKTSPFLTLLNSGAGTAYAVVANLGRKAHVAEVLAEQFKFIDKDQALKLLRLEDKYLRKFYPWWQKFI